MYYARSLLCTVEKVAYDSTVCMGEEERLLTEREPATPAEIRVVPTPVDGAFSVLLPRPTDMPLRVELISSIGQRIILWTKEILDELAEHGFWLSEKLKKDFLDRLGEEL